MAAIKQQNIYKLASRFSMYTKIVYIGIFMGFIQVLYWSDDNDDCCVFQGKESFSIWTVVQCSWAIQYTRIELIWIFVIFSANFVEFCLVEAFLLSSVQCIDNNNYIYSWKGPFTSLCIVMDEWEQIDKSMYYFLFLLLFFWNVRLPYQDYFNNKNWDKQFSDSRKTN